MIRKIFKILLPILILSAGVWGTHTLLNSKEPPESKKRRSDKVTLVEVAKIRKKTYPINIQSNAKTQSASKLPLSSEIKGRVQWISDKFTEGGWVSADSKLFVINPEDYQLKVEQAKAKQAEAQYELTLALTQQKAAVRQQQVLAKSKNRLSIPNLNQGFSNLASYEPQVKKAEANLTSANASLKQAELELQRTTITAPFDGYIQTIDIAVGQLVQSGQTVGTLIKAKPILIKAPISLEELPWIEVSERRGELGRGSKAKIVKTIGNKTHVWWGEVKRQLQEVDSLGKTVTVLIEVEDVISDYQTVLPLGLFVDVVIQGLPMHKTIGIPHGSLRANNTVWLVSPENTLEIMNVDIKWKTADEFLITGGLRQGDQLITSYLPNPIPGLKVTVFDPNKKPVQQQRKRAADGKKPKISPKDKRIQEAANSSSQTKSNTNQKQKGWAKSSN